MNDSRLLIITADDFGLSAEVNHAIAIAARRGVLSAASLMVAAPAAAEAIEIAHALPKLRVGLHIVLTDGKSALPHEVIPDLVDTRGHFRHNMLRASLAYAWSRAARAQARAEIREQFEVFAKSGLELDHVNTHKHFHHHPLLLDMILEIGRDYGLTAMRLPAEPLGCAAHAGVPGILGAAIRQPWVALMRQRLRRAGCLHNERLFGIAYSGKMRSNTLRRLLSQPAAGVTEIYLHPVLPPKIDRSRAEGFQELVALLDAEVMAAALKWGPRGGFRDIRQPNSAH